MTAAPPSTPRTAHPPRVPPQPVSRLRRAPSGALAFAALVLVAVFVATALPRALDTSADDALRAALDRAQPADRMLSATAPAAPWTDQRGELLERMRPESVGKAEQALRAAVHAPLEARRADAAYGVHNAEPAEADDPGLPRTSPGLNPRATLAAQAGLAAHTKVAQGRLPGAEVKGPQGDRRLQAAITRDTARTMKLKPGDTFHLPASTGGTTVEVTGILAPRGDTKTVRESAFWSAQESTARPFLVKKPSPLPGDKPKTYWHFTAFLHPKATPALLELQAGAELYFHYTDPAAGLAGHQAAAARDQLARMTTGPEGAAVQERAGVGQLTFDNGLQDTLAAYEEDSAAVSPLLLIAVLGLAVTVLTVLLLAGVLTAERRAAELALLRSRGASLPGLAGRLLAETGPLALLAGLVGAGLALLVTSGTRTGPALLAGAATAVVAALALPVRAALTHRGVRTTSARRDVTTVRPSRRRTVLELTVLALVVAAVVALRQRGSDEGDALSALAPVLLALLAAMLLMRCYPVPLRLLGRLAARRPGPVAFLGLARAGRAPAAAVSGLALLAVLVALTVASFGGTVLAGVADGRDRAALEAVGADARIETPDVGDVIPELVQDVRKSAGVGQVTAFRTHDDGELSGVTDGLTVALVDAPAYARLAEHYGTGAFDPGVLTSRRAGQVPALVSPGVARGLRGAGDGSGTVDLLLPGLQVPVRAAAVRDHTPAARRGEFVVLSRAAVAKARPAARGSALLAPDTLLATGDPDPGTLRGLLKKADPKGQADALVLLRSEERAKYAGSVLQSGAERLYLAAVLAAAGFSALAVLLSLLQTAPDRTALLARLRTLGLPRRQGRGVLLLESLPLFVLTAAVGALTGLATVPLLGPGIDLAALAGTPEGLAVPLSADPASLVLPPLALVLLAAAGLLLQARLAGRTTTEARMEES